MVKPERSDSLLRDFGQSVAGTLLVQAIMFASGVVIARKLGPDGKGVLAVLLTVPNLLISFGDLGIARATMFFLGKQKERRPEILGSSIATVSFLSIVLLGVGFVFVSADLLEIYDDPTIERLAFLALVLIPFRFLERTINNSLIAVNRVFEKNVFSVTFETFRLVAILVVALFFDLSVLAVVSIYIATICVLSIAQWIYVAMVSGGLRLPSRDMFFDLLRFGGWSYLSAVVVSAIVRLNPLMLASLATWAAAGVFSVAMLFVTLFGMLPSTLAGLVMGHVSRRSAEESDLLLVQSARLVSVVSVFAGVLAAVVVPFFIPLIYGGAFEESGALFLVLLPGAMLMNPARVANGYLVGTGRPYIGVLCYGGPAILSVALSLYLIPKIGALGAALSFSVAQCVGTTHSLLLCSHVSKRSIGHLLIPRSEDWGNLLSRLRRPGPDSHGTRSGE